MGNMVYPSLTCCRPHDMAMAYHAGYVYIFDPSKALQMGLRSLQALSTGVDLVVCTPGRLRKMHARGEVSPTTLHHSPAPTGAQSHWTVILCPEEYHFHAALLSMLLLWFSLWCHYASPCNNRKWDRMPKPRAMPASDKRGWSSYQSMAA